MMSLRLDLLHTLFCYFVLFHCANDFLLLTVMKKFLFIAQMFLIRSWHTVCIIYRLIDCSFVSRLFDRPQMSIHPSTKSLFNFNEIWRVGRGRQLMHGGMQYDPIEGQGHEFFRVGNSAIFKSYLLRLWQWELATDHGCL